MTLDRSDITQELLFKLRTSFLVGDNVAPYEGGWLKGTPGDQTFEEYLVLAAGRVALVDSYLRMGCYEYELNYTLSHFSDSRKGVDSMSYTSRSLLMDGNLFKLKDYKAQSVIVKAMGRMVRNDATDPPLWSEADTLVVKCVPWS